MIIGQDFKLFCLEASNIIIEKFRNKKFQNKDQEKLNLEASVIKVTISKSSEHINIKENDSVISISEDFLVYTMCKGLLLFEILYVIYKESINTATLTYELIFDRWKYKKNEELEEIGVEKYFNTNDPHFNNNAYFWHLKLRDKHLFKDINIPFDILSEYLNFKKWHSRPLKAIQELNKKMEAYKLDKGQKLFIYDKLNGLIASADPETRDLLTHINIEILNTRNQIEPMEVDTKRYNINEIVRESKQYDDINEQIKFLKRRKLEYEQDANDSGLGKEIDIEVEFLITQLKTKKNSGKAKKTRETLTKDIIVACAQLQGLNKTLQCDEDSRNIYVARALDNLGYNVKDQTKWGASEKGIKLGEIDIKIEDNSKRTISICEGLNLVDCDKTKITSHINKIFDYDSNGVLRNYILVYSGSNKFLTLWNKYINLINTIDYQYKLESEIVEVNGSFNPFADIKICKGIHKRNNSKTELIHVFVNMNLK